MKDILADLNPQQREAVSAPDGQTLVLAGPGSGKTRVLTQRAAYLIKERNVDPYRILAVTFTNKAAREMQDRLQRSLGSNLDGLWLGTFHATCARILRREADHLPFTRDFVIMDADDQKSLIKLSLKELNLDDKLYPPNSVHASISNAKNNLVQAEDFTPGNYREEVTRRVFERYQEKLNASNALDFDDLLLYAVKLLHENDSVREKYSRRFFHVLVDEFQDTNQAQYELLQLLCSYYKNIFVVGDEDQSIYRWRGADYRNVLRFQKDYPEHTKLLLERNYRSTQNVLDAARAVIDRNTQRTPKKLFSKRGKGDKIVLFEAMDDHGEAMFAVDTIRSLMETQKARGGEIAIMYRTNAQSRLLEEAFFQSRIPYKLVGAQRFYGRQEVKDMIAYLRTIQNPSDEVSFLRVINLPPRGIGSKTLLDLRSTADNAQLSMGSVVLDLGKKREESAFWDAFSARAANALASFGKLLINWRTLNESIVLPELFEHVLKDTNYQEYITDSSDVGYSRWENVQELLRMAYEYSHAGLVGFLENLALVSDQDTLPEKQDVPTLLTLHAAKGLEFKVVFIIGLDEGTLPHRRSMEDPEEMAEERRLFYVGITRAKDHLYLVRADQRRNYGSFDYSIPSRFLEDIPENLLIRAGMQYRRRSRTSIDATIPRWPTEKEKKKKTPVRSEVEFTAGMHVKHAILGKGIVIQSKLQDGDEIVTVAFDTAGLKKLSATIAKLEVV